MRRLKPWFRNVGKRLTKAPKVYLRDTGLLHHLLNIASHEQLDAHPSRGASWEGFVIDDILRRERQGHLRREQLLLAQFGQDRLEEIVAEVKSLSREPRENRPRGRDQSGLPGLHDDSRGTGHRDSEPLCLAAGL